MQPPDSGESRFSAEDWSAYLSERLERRVRVRFGRARHNVLVAHDEHDSLAVRMNALFSTAPDEVRAATASWLRSGKRARKASALLDAWVASLEPRLRETGRGRPSLRPAGAVHDLAELERGLLEVEFLRVSFPLGQKPAITWGRRGRARRQLQLGSFDPETNLVRLHPVLDQPAVPRFFVRYVLFHELLHAALPTPKKPGGRVVHHGPAFRRREHAYADYHKALAWQAEHLRELLRSSATGEQMPKAGRKKARGPLAAVQRWLFPEASPDDLHEVSAP